MLKTRSFSNFFPYKFCMCGKKPYLCIRFRERTLAQSKLRLTGVGEHKERVLWKDYIRQIKVVQEAKPRPQGIRFRVEEKRTVKFVWLWTWFWKHVLNRLQTGCHPGAALSGAWWSNLKNILQCRVWSWLRMNASYRLNTCKSRGSMTIACYCWWRPAHGWVTRIQPSLY